MLLELHDNKPVGAFDPATLSMIGKVFSWVKELANEPGMGWFKDVVNPSGAEKARFDKLMARTIRNNYALIRDPKTLEIIKPAQGIQQLDFLNCQQLRLLEHNFVNHYIPYFSNKNNYRKGTKKRVINRYKAVYRTLLKGVQKRISDSKCPPLNQLNFTTQAVNPAPFTITGKAAQDYAAGDKMLVNMNGKWVEITSDQPSPSLPGMDNPNANPIIPLGLIALALNL